jgi:hypothetical protein
MFMPLLLAVLSPTVELPIPPARPTLVPDASRRRITEIDSEMRALQLVPTSSEIFRRTATRVLPLWAIGAAPLTLGTYFMTSRTASPADSGSRPILFAAGVFAVTTVVSLAICLFAAVDHWISEAEEAPHRHARLRSLESEREGLLSRAPGRAR